MKRSKIVIRTEKQFTDLRPHIEEVIKGSHGVGMVNVFVAHTTCAIKIMEGEILLLSDVNEHLEHMFPQVGGYRHDMIGIRDVPTTERVNGAAHMRQLFFDVTVNVPVEDGKLLLGQWQSIFLVEFDPVRDRIVYITYTGDSK